MPRLRSLASVLPLPMNTWDAFPLSSEEQLADLLVPLTENANESRQLQPIRLECPGLRESDSGSDSDSDYVYESVDESGSASSSDADSSTDDSESEEEDEEDLTEEIDSLSLGIPERVPTPEPFVPIGGGYPPDRYFALTVWHTNGSRSIRYVAY
ncbi:hypothetical protein MKEN_00638900 [Mycena kentingensis (nom. inval.)]|nr:hypothetical protein MKEN_00638900 [Mycena kentingensis (nom. inval.)]